jgi:hypothetical protein
MCEPSEDKWIAIAQGFERNAKVPNCIGALDGKHIRLTNPDHAGSLYRNYENVFSLVLMPMCDASYVGVLRGSHVPNSGSLFNLVDKELRVKYVAVHDEVCSVLLQGEQHLHKLMQRSARFI